MIKEFNIFKIAILITVLFGFSAVCAEFYINAPNGKKIKIEVTVFKTGMDLIAPYVEEFNKRFKANIEPSQVLIFLSSGLVLPDTPLTNSQVTSSALFRAAHKN